MSLYSEHHSSCANRPSISAKLMRQFALFLLCVSAFCTKQSFALTPTKTTLDVSGHSYSWSRAVTLTATVKTTDGKPVTPGQVVFCKSGATYCEDSAILGKAQLKSDGTASIKLLLSIGKHDIYTKFIGTTAYSPSTSLPAVQTIEITGKYNSLASIIALDTAGTYTLAAPIIAVGSEVPTGTVTFLDAANPSHTWASVALDGYTEKYGFGNTSVYLSGDHHNPFDLQIADLNNDGVPDLVLANDEAPSSVTVLLGDAAHPGSYLAGKTFLTGSSASGADSDPLMVAVGDFNNDGFPDVAVGASNDLGKTTSGTKVSVLLNDPSNPGKNFLPYQQYTAGPGILTLSAEDFNGDGILDLLAVTYGMPGATTPIPMQANVLLGDPAHPGKFFPPISSAIPGVGLPGNNSAVCADFNQDGLPDFAVLVGTSPKLQTVHLFLNNPNSPGTFQDANSFSLPYFSWDLLAADFNHDGIPDLGVSGSESSTDPASVELYLADSTHHGQFLPKTVFPFLPTANIDPVVVGDFNADGWMDIATEDGGVAFDILYGDPANPGKFLSVAQIPSGARATAEIHAADLNGDGLVDLVGTLGYPPNPQANYRNGYVYAHLAGQSQTVSAPQVAIGAGPQYVIASYSGDANYYGHNSCAIAVPQTGQSGPVVSGLTVSNLGRNSATITWTTNIGTNGQVAYGVTSGLGTLSPWIDAPSTSHAITLNGLTPGTTYYYATESIAFFNGCTHWTTFTPTTSFTTLP